MVSEEETKAVVVEKKFAGRFAIAFDPLDGSANLDANVSVGSIFGIWIKKQQDVRYLSSPLILPK